jgi:flagellar hook-basal body complex protein FliE
MNAIGNINNLALPPQVPLVQPAVGGIAALGGAGGATPAEGTSFKDFLLNSIQQVNSMQADADNAVEGLFSGGDASPAEVLTAVQKADLAFRMMMQIRNKLAAAYDEFKNIRI